jgi:hypothetical protein
VYKDSHASKIPCEHLCILTIANMAKVRKFGTLNVSGMCTLGDDTKCFLNERGVRVCVGLKF